MHGYPRTWDNVDVDYLFRSLRVSKEFLGVDIMYLHLESMSLDYMKSIIDTNRLSSMQSFYKRFAASTCSTS